MERKKAGPPKGNSNAEKYDEEGAIKLFEDAVKLSLNLDYDFIGEIAKELGTYIDVFDHLVRRFPNLKHLKAQMKRNCEVNCYSNTKNNVINTAAGIINLKSNHKWTDRTQTDHTTKGDKIESKIVVSSPESAKDVDEFFKEVEGE